MHTQLKITPRNLGLILLGTFCPKCFWFLLRLRFKPPFNKGGGAIFSSMQAIQEAVLGNFLAQNGCLPEEFHPFTDITERVQCSKHWRNFGYEHESGVWLYGMPDEVVRRKNGKICIIDHKTAVNKGTNDPFYPIYQTQIIGYSMIAERGLNLGQASNPGLFYWQIDHKSVIEKPSNFYKNKQVWPGFSVKPLEVKLDYEVLEPLLETAIELWESSQPPDGREACPDCEQLAKLMALEDELVAADNAFMQRVSMAAPMCNSVFNRTQDRKWKWRSALQQIQMNDLQPIEFSPDGMFSSWED